MPLKVAIVGRPNVGKSTLFNRLVGKKLALVDDQPGVTRDRREGDAKLGDLRFTIMDTAGLEESHEDSLSGRMRAQTEEGIAQADVVLFLTDARQGITPDDRTFADLVRRSEKPIILLANKAEGKVGLAGAYEAFELGIGDPIAFSAEHGEGLADLFAALMPLHDAKALEEEHQDKSKPTMVAIVGRPNAGKSTLINALIGEERLLVGPEAGITRDSISVDFDYEGKPFRLVDTAGLRKRAKVEGKLEKLSVGDTLRAINFAEVVVVCMDCEKPFEDQDLKIAELAANEGRAVVIAFTKSDLMAKTGGILTKMRQETDHWLPQIKGVPIVMLSAYTGEGLKNLMQAVEKAKEVWGKRVNTSVLNRWLIEAVQTHKPPAVSGRAIRIRYVTQIKTRPPTFMAFCSRPEVLPESYERYLVNSLRQNFDLKGTPIRFQWKKPDNPYGDKD